MLVFACGCRNSFPVTTIDSDQYLGYIPIDPLPVAKVRVYDPDLNLNKEVYWKSIKDNDLIRSLLPLQSAQVAISKIEASGKVNYTGASLSGDVGSYKVIMDYMKYRIADAYDKNGQYLGSGRIGIGLRIKAELVTSKANLNLGSISAIGLEANMNNLSGGISIDIIGIDSEHVTNLIPLTSEIDQTSIQSALQALASIKSKLWEEETNITPHLVAIQQSIPDANSKIRQELTSTKYMQSDYGDIIRNYWKPDGVSIDQSHEEEILEWMENNNLDTGPGSLTMFIVSNQHEDMRKKLVEDLRLAESQ
jgi:hypothetical protein